MLREVSKEEYRKYFTVDHHPYITEVFIALNEKKQERVIRLMSDKCSSIGLLVGLKEGKLRSPFSAPFGGFHYTHEYIDYSLIEEFLTDLKEYITDNGLEKISITLPPDLYQENMNAKLVNAFIRLGYKMEIPDMTNCVNLIEFNGNWVKSEIGRNCRRAVKNGFMFSVATEREEMEEVYKLVQKNREGLGRKIHMTFDDVLEVADIFPVDFFSIREKDGNYIGAAILYRAHKTIVQGIFMGGDLEKRNLGVIDFMYMSCSNYYKEMGFKYIDLGTSSLDGEPNVGLLRFKEIHHGETSLRYSFTWKNE